MKPGSLTAGRGVAVGLVCGGLKIDQLQLLQSTCRALFSGPEKTVTRRDGNQNRMRALMVPLAALIFSSARGPNSWSTSMTT